MNCLCSVLLAKYYWSDQIEKNAIGGYVAHVMEMSRGFMVGKPEGKRPLGLPRRRWENKIKTDLQEVVWGMDWIDLA